MLTTYRIASCLAFLTSFGLMLGNLEVGGIFAAVALSVEAMRLAVGWFGPRL